MKVSKRQSSHLAATIGEDGIGNRLTTEQVDQVKQAYDNMVSELTHIFAKTSAVTPATVRASRAAAAFFNAKQMQKLEEPENDHTPKRKM